MMAETLELEPRSMMEMFAALGIVATLLAFTGIYTLVAFAVVQRTSELGVRMALGARPADVLATLVAQYALPIAVGTTIGVALAIGAAQVLRSQLHGLTPLDPLSHLAGLAGVAGVALVAILVPARRALRIDPATALRAE
jgi:ABC-type antimicrobial peptide transport system permease subunit